MNKIKQFIDALNSFFYITVIFGIRALKAVFSREDRTIVDKNTQKIIKEYNSVVGKHGDKSEEACKFIDLHANNTEFVRYALEKRK
jgi:hypothetical protein